MLHPSSRSRKRKRSTDETKVIDLSVRSESLERGSVRQLVYPFTVFRLPRSEEDFMFVKDEVKKCIRKLLLMVLKVQQSGYYLLKSSFKRDNLSIKNNVIKFRSLRLRKRKYAYNKECGAGNFKMWLRKCEYIRSRNFNLLRKLLLSTFFRRSVVPDRKQIPSDMCYFLELLRTYRRKNIPLLKYNFSLMNDKARRNYMAELWDRVREFDADKWESYQSACDYLPYGETWTAQMDVDSHLHAVYTHRDAKYTGCHTDEPHFYRNALAHLLEQCWEKDKGEEESKLVFGYEDCEKMISSTFPATISRFQHLLLSFNLLMSFKPQDYFY